MRVYPAGVPRVFVYPETKHPVEVKHPVGEEAMLIVRHDVWFSQKEELRQKVLSGEVKFLEFMRLIDA